MTPEIKVGQEWMKANNNRKGATRIRVLEGPCFQQVVVGTVTKDGRVIRRRNLLVSALTNTPSGYVLAKDAPPEATSGHSCDNCEGIHPESCMFNPPEAKADGPRHQLDVMAERLGATPPAAPSPLEVVREALEHMRHFGEHAGDVRRAERGLRALATLEEAIRADERARVGDELQRRGYPVAGGAVLAMKR